MNIHSLIPLTICGLLCGLHFHSACFAADTIRVTTWNLEWFPSGKPTKADPKLEEQRIQAAADIIEVLNPDVLLLQEVRDWETCEKLAKAVKSLRYKVAVVSAFKEFGSVGWQQEAILAKTDAESAWSASWSTKGAVDPPRGYAFATFRFSGRLVGFYSIHLKSNLIRGGDVAKQAQTNILKRELAAEQLMAHVGEMQTTFPTMKRLAVGGDFNTNSDQADFISERTLGIFSAAELPRFLRLSPCEGAHHTSREGRVSRCDVQLPVDEGTSDAAPQKSRAAASLITVLLR